MEIIPGEGLPDVRIGARRADVVAAVGEPVTDGGVAWYHDAHPPFSVHYDADHVVEYVEVDPSEPEDPEDERLVAEGVGIAPISYWRDDG
jgi:hypothetical protein